MYPSASSKTVCTIIKWYAYGTLQFAHLSKLCTGDCRLVTCYNSLACKHQLCTYKGLQAKLDQIGAWPPHDALNQAFLQHNLQHTSARWAHANSVKTAQASKARSHSHDLAVLIISPTTNGLQASSPFFAVLIASNNVWSAAGPRLLSDRATLTWMPHQAGPWLS